MWDSSTPKRTGVPTLLVLARNTCRLLALFTPTIKAHLEVSRHVYVDALNQACADFVDNIDHPRNNE